MCLLRNIGRETVALGRWKCPLICLLVPRAPSSPAGPANCRQHLELWGFEGLSSKRGWDCKSDLSCLSVGFWCNFFSSSQGHERERKQILHLSPLCRVLLSKPVNRNSFKAFTPKLTGFPKLMKPFFKAGRFWCLFALTRQQDHLAACASKAAVRVAEGWCWQQRWREQISKLSSL